MKRVNSILVFLTVVLIILTAKITLHFISPGAYQTERIPALRGEIHDSKGRILATSEILFVAYLDVRYLRSHLKDSYKTDPVFINFISKFGLIPNDLDDKSIIRLGEFKSRDSVLKQIPPRYVKFISIEPEEKRISITDSGLNFIIGKTDGRTGISGIEKTLDKILRPVRDGYYEVITAGWFGKKIEESFKQATNGKNVTLSIDSQLQKLLYEQALLHSKRSEAAEIGIIVMESNTGKIRAMVTTASWPTYYLGYFEPGSVIKPIIFSSALEMGFFKENDIFNCEGSIKLEDLGITIKDLEKHGEITLYDAVVHSCNVAAVAITKKIVDTYGQEGLYSVLKSFGFGEPTGIELPGEIPGALRQPEKWYKSEWAYLSIGQSIGASPIQIISAFNTIVNGGKYVKPTLLEDNKVVEKVVISQKTANLVKNMLLDVVERGTGKLAKLEGYKIYGKTGTAQKNQRKDVTALFAGQIELDIPYTILVWVDTPKSGKLSSLVAAPVFREVVELLLERKDLSQEENIVPNVLGWNMSMLQTLKNKFVLKIKGEGLYVIEQTPEPGSESTSLTITLGKSLPQIYEK